VIARNVDIAWHADNSKSITALGMTYRPLQETMEDMFAFMIEAGFFKRG
jgi:dihydroflavonol-4-reductase